MFECLLEFVCCVGDGFLFNVLVVVEVTAGGEREHVVMHSLKVDLNTVLIRREFLRGIRKNGGEEYPEKN